MNLNKYTIYEPYATLKKLNVVNLNPHAHNYHTILFHIKRPTSNETPSFKTLLDQFQWNASNINMLTCFKNKLKIIICC